MRVSPAFGKVRREFLSVRQSKVRVSPNCSRVCRRFRNSPSLSLERRGNAVAWGKVFKRLCPGVSSFSLPFLPHTLFYDIVAWLFRNSFASLSQASLKPRPHNLQITAPFLNTYRDNVFHSRCQGRGAHCARYRDPLLVVAVHGDGPQGTFSLFS